MVTVDVDEALAVGAMLPKARAVALMEVHAAPVMVADTAKVVVAVPACDSDGLKAQKVAAIAAVRVPALTVRGRWLADSEITANGLDIVTLPFSCLLREKDQDSDPASIPHVAPIPGHSVPLK
jgi:hypothetical protein